MIRYNSRTRMLVVQLPRWRDRRVLVAFIFILTVNALVSYIDRPLAETMRGLDPVLVHFFGKLTKAGDSRFTLIPLALLLPFIFATRQALGEGSVRRMLNWMAQAVSFVFVAVAASGILVNIIKVIVGRTRPRLWFEDGLYGFAPFTFGESVFQSFPSGHSQTAFALAVALSFFIPRWRKALLAMACVIAGSRVIITAHYLSDVIGGSIIGATFAVWLRGVYARHGWVFIKRRGEYHLAAPGYLLGQKLRAALWDRLGLPDGARGRLP